MFEFEPWERVEILWMLTSIIIARILGKTARIIGRTATTVAQMREKKNG